jgi:hypothetical protein
MNLSALLSKTVIKHRFSRDGRATGKRRALQEGHNLTVLQVTPELNAGGVERTTLEIAEAISRAGGLALVATAGGRLEPDLKTTGGELIRIPAASKNPITLIANAFKLAKVARERHVQIIHARSRAPAWSALLAARMAKVPFVTTYHGIYNAKSPLKAFYNSVMARGDAIIANSEFTREHILTNHDVMPERITAIPRGVDLDVFDPAKISADEIAALRTKWGVQPNQCVVLVPARLTRWKGQMILIEAARARCSNAVPIRSRLSSRVMIRVAALTRRKCFPRLKLADCKTLFRSSATSGRCLWRSRLQAWRCFLSSSQKPLDAAPSKPKRWVFR